jgi:prepilin-type N-terminal cleavage/methylation domain-containing protein
MRNREMKNRESGFTLLEILIAIAILGIIMAMNSTLLQDMIRNTRQQGTIVTSQFEAALGMEIFRNDLGNAGSGLPDAFLTNPAGAVSGTYTGTCYNEPAGHASNPAAVAAFNDCPNPPRAIVHSNNVGSANGYLANSDYLVIRSPAVGMNSATNKWTYIINDAAPVKVWNDSSLDMQTNDYMIVIRPRVAIGGTAQLVRKTSGAYLVQYSGSAMADTDFVPLINERYIAYGVDSDTALTKPFNRADYFVRRTTATSAGCAPGTGTLFKAVADQAATSAGFTSYPIMDCVANMQVVFRLDTNGDGTIDSTVGTTPAMPALTAMQIKEQVKEIQVYILAHEGTFDRGYRHGGNGTITVGPNNALGYSVVLPTLVGADWDRYRWKTYTLSVKPRSLY